MEEIEENIRKIEDSVSNIVSKVKLMIETIKSVNKSSYSLCLVSMIMINYEDEKKFIQKYEYYLHLFNTLLSFFRVEELNPYNKDLFHLFIDISGQWSRFGERNSRPSCRGAEGNNNNN